MQNFKSHSRPSNKSLNFSLIFKCFVCTLKFDHTNYDSASEPKSALPRWAHLSLVVSSVCFHNRNSPQALSSETFRLYVCQYFLKDMLLYTFPLKWLGTSLCWLLCVWFKFNPQCTFLSSFTVNWQRKEKSYLLKAKE